MRLYLVGLGPGSLEHLTLRAAEVLKTSQAVVGYGPYVDLVEAWFPDPSRLAIRGTLGQEKARAREAIRLAREERLRVALVSSGDAGIYGIGGPLFQTLLEDGWTGDDPRVEVVPGVTAALSANALLGAPLADDLALISLSDILTPWSVIAQRLEAAAEADFVVALYNPASTRRREGLHQARSILLRHRAADTPVALVRNALRAEPSVCLTTLADLPHASVDMLTLVVVGNSQTVRLGGDKLVSRRTLASLASRVKGGYGTDEPAPVTRGSRPRDRSTFRPLDRWTVDP
jgi:precorrin-3B C17-methyltransferase